MAPARAIAPLAPLWRELARKALHFATCAVPVAYALGVSRAHLLVLLGSTCGVALLVEGARRVHAPSREAFRRVFGSLLRPFEHERLTGATWLAVACVAAVAVLPRPAAVAALWAATAGDAAAAISGVAWRTWRGVPPQGRSIAGSTTLLVVSAVGVVALTGVSPVTGLLVGLSAAAAERASGRLDDNAVIATAAAASFILLS